MDWNPLSPSGIRLLGEVVMDEVALTGMTLTAPPPKLERSVESCAAAAEELSTLGVARRSLQSQSPLQVKAIRRHRFGRLVYERLTFEHDPLLPRSLAAEGLGGPATAAVHLCRARRRPAAVAGVGARRGPGSTDRPAVLPSAARPGRAGFQHRAAGAAGPRCRVATRGRPIRTWTRWPMSRA